MENNKNELTLFNGNVGAIYCSKEAKTDEEKKDLFNALESCDALLNDCVGQEINLKDVYCEEKEVLDEESGETRKKYRTILFDVSGQTYATGSYGIFNIMKKIFAIFVCMLTFVLGMYAQVELKMVQIDTTPISDVTKVNKIEMLSHEVTLNQYETVMGDKPEDLSKGSFVTGMVGNELGSLIKKTKKKKNYYQWKKAFGL